MKKSVLRNLIIMASLSFILGLGDALSQTTFTANATGNWTTLAWSKSGTPTTAAYPGQPGYEAETHDVVINMAGITVTLDANIVSSVRNLTLTSGTLNISSNSLTMTGNLSGGAILSFTSGTINIAGDNTSSGTFNTGTGTFNYNGSNQSIRGTTYYNLVISGINTKSPAANTVVSNNLNIFSGQLNSSSSDLTVNGLTTIYSGGSFTPGSPARTITFKDVTLSGGSILSTSGAAPVITVSGNLLVNNNASSSITKIKLTVTGTTQVQTGSTLALDGPNGSCIFNGLVTINGSWNNSANNDCELHNGLNFNGPSFSSGTGLYTFNTNSQAIGGTSPLIFNGNVIVGTGGMILTNSSVVTIIGVLSASNNTTWRNASNSVLNYENATIPMGASATRVLDASSVPNIVNYSGSGNQSVKAAVYHNIIFSGSGTKTLAGAISVNGNLAISGTANLLTNQYQITGNATGTFTMSSGTGLMIGNPVVATNVSFPTNFISANVSLDPASTVNYQANTAQTVSAVPVYGNLSTASSGIKALGSDITVKGNLNIGTNTTLDASAGNYNIALAGSWISSGIFNRRLAKVTFNGSGVQSILNTLIGSETFYNVEFNTTGPVTSTINLNAANSLIMTTGIILMPGKTFLLGTGAANPGTLTHTSGWIAGTFSRWATSVHNGIDLLFPIGNNSLERDLIINFSNVATAGALSVNFIEAPPSGSGLPLSEGGFTFAQLFPEGYWNLIKDATFSFTGSFNLKLVPAGFTAFPIDANTRVVSRFSASDWFLNGVHAPGSSAMLFRNTLTSFTNNYAVAYAEICNPTLTNCPADQVVNNLPGTCSNSVTWVPPTISVPCAGYSITSNYNPGDSFNAGITQVIYYLWNGPVKRDSCKFNVTVLDVETPVVLCRNINFYIGPLGSSTLTGADIDNGSSDNCSIILVPGRTNFTCADVGLTIPVLLTGTDPSGNFATCTSQVTVRDTMRPTINTKTYTVILDATGNGTLLASDIDNGTFDNCTPVTLSVAPNTFTCADQGPKNVTFTAVDAYGNTAAATVQITVASSLKINSMSLSTCDLAGPFALYESAVSGGNGTYSYFWDGLDNSVDPFITITGTFPFLIFSNTTTQPTPFFNNLMPDGTYTIRLIVTDGNGCTDTMDMIIDKTGFVFNNITTRYTNACEGSTVNYSVAYNPAATYNWGVSNGTILTSPLDTNAIDVRWNIGVTQGVVISTASKTDLLGNPCVSTVVDTVTIGPVPTPVFDNPLTNVCSNSVVTYTTTDIYPGYTWVVTGGAITAGGTGSSFVSVRWGPGPTGKVTVTVQAGPGCSNSASVDITIDNLTGSVTSLTEVTCNGAGDGKVTVAASTGIPPFEYSLEGTPYQSSGSFTGIIPGIHNVTIRDAFMCTFDVGFTMTQPPVLSVSVTKVDITCFGDLTGSITASGSGGRTPYEYSLDGGSFQASGIFNGLAAGIHPLVIRDANLCTKSQNISISQPATALNGVISSQTNITCFGGNNGSVTVTASGGTAPYEYRLDAGTYQASGTFSLLPAGNYTVTIRDANLCIFSVPVSITQPAAPVGGTITSQTNVDCNGNSTGSITVAGSGGTSPYNYSLNGGPFQLSGSFVTLSPGNYNVTVRDANLCTFNVPVTITEPPILAGSIASQNNVTCFGGSDGQVTIAGSGGTLPYQYSIDGGLYQVSATFMGLIAGSYTITIQDANLCTVIVPVTITEPLAIVVTASSNTPVCATGTINLSGGPGGMTTYSWTGPNGFTSLLQNPSIIGATPAMGGVYTLTVTDINGCTAFANTNVVVTPVNTITLTSAPGTDNQTVCINTAITSITYATTGATGATFTGLPAGVTGNWAANAVTISGTPTAAGTFNFTVNLSGGCGTITASGTIIVTPDNTITLTSAPGTNNQTVCINTAITSITYVTTGATGATFTGLPAGVTGNWAANAVTISGTPTAAGTFNFTVNMTGGCGTISASGTIIVTPDNTITLTSAPGTDNQTVCINTAITSITYATTGATGATFTGLPAGVTGNWAANAVTISGTPTAASTFNYTVNLTGGCGTISDSGTIIVTPDNTITLTSTPGTDNQTVCINTAITSITYVTTGATGATFTGLPAGVTGNWAANTVTISGIPTTAGAFNYTVTLTGGCGVITSSGSIIVNADNTITLTSTPGTDNQTVCINTAITGITYATTGATGATFTGLPAGVTGNWAANAVTISGTPTAAGTFNYTVNLTGGCGTITASGTIIVTPDNTITLTSAPGTDNQSACTNIAITDITYASTGATGANFTGLPSGVSGNWAANVATISGTPTAAGTFNYSVNLTGGCGTVTASGTIVVSPADTIALTSAPGTDNQTQCINTALTDITYTTTGATGATFAGLPAGVTGNWAAGVVTISGIPSVSGTFNYTVTPTGGCGPIVAKGTINVNPIPVLIITNPPVVCSPSTVDLTAASVTAGSTPGLTLTYWTDSLATSPYATPASATSGKYYIKGEDASGCSDIKPVIATVNPSLTVSVSVTDVLCFGDSTGAISLTVSGGMAPYSFLWSNGATTMDISNLTAGTYSVTITDAGGCTANASGNVTEPVSALSGTTVVTDVLCFGAKTGAIDLTVTGGTAPYTYLWNNGTVTEDLDSLAAGAYTVTITDANGCVATAGGTVNEPAAALNGSVTVTDVLCFGGNTGQVNLIVTGGTAPYTFTWNTGDTTQNLTNVPAGNYMVDINDANGCDAKASGLVTEPALLGGTTVVTDVTCGNNGAVILTVTGGTTPYSYLWSNGDTTKDIISLSAGIYTVIITDANGCTANTGGTVNLVGTPLNVTASVTDVLCYGASTGSITLTVTGGTAPYTFLWSNGATTADLDSIPAGNYSVAVTEAGGCTVNIGAVVSEPVAPLSATTVVNNILCFGGGPGSIDLTVTGGTAPYTFLWSNGSVSEDLANLPAGNYTVVITDANGCTLNSGGIVTEPAAALSSSATVSNVTCKGTSTGTVNLTVTGGTAPYSYLWSNGDTTQNINSLPAGNYTVTITDAGGCTSSASADVTEPATDLTSAFTVTNVLCNGGNTGAITLTVSGGIGPYTYLWSDGAATKDIMDLMAGTYSVTVTDSAGCVINPSVQVTEPGKIAIDPVVTDASCPGVRDGSITITITGGTGPFTILWSDGKTTATRSATDSTYRVIVTDINLCTAVLDVVVAFNQREACLQIPEVITPNGDGKNDTWIIKNIDLYPNAEVLVFNRWGELVYQTKNIAANPWDGRFRGTLVPVDSYHYILYLNDGSKPRTGVITVIR